MATLKTGKESSTSRSKLKNAVSAMYVDKDYSNKDNGPEKYQCLFSMYLEFEIYFFHKKIGLCRRMNNSIKKKRSWIQKGTEYRPGLFPN